MAQTLSVYARPDAAASRFVPDLADLAAAGILAFSVALSLSLAFLQPIPEGREYGSAVACTLFLAGLAVCYRFREKLLHNAWFLGAAFVAGAAMGVVKLATIPVDSEVLRVYASVFDLLEHGQNPYVVPAVFHADTAGHAVWGTFNYPPLEILPFWLARLLTGQWNAAVFTGTVLALQLLVLLVLRSTLPRVPLWKLAACFPVMTLLAVQTNTALTFLAVALILKVVVARHHRHRRHHRWLLWLLFGLGLNTKFIVLPLLGALVWHDVRLGDPRTLVRAAVDVFASLAVALLVLLPFGVVDVFRSTVMFNLVLDDRALLTTYYPNVLSALFYLLDARVLYPVAAVSALAAAVLLGARFSLAGALLTACFAFLLVIPTPELQYMPVMVYLTLVIAHAPDVFGLHAPVLAPACRADLRVVGAARFRWGRFVRL
jgi:hypothetical protein